MYSVREKFDETFDQFFDEKEIRQKYNDWNEEDDCPKFEKTNNDIEQLLDKEDMSKFINFYENYISELKDELAELSK
jgi:hypothetical protein